MSYAKVLHSIVVVVVAAAAAAAAAVQIHFDKEQKH